ncbi:hypothetical protein ACFWR6_16630 [Streptomyces griseus]|uniref:hypothetical protein n=1 Tax=Streptomyces griseus TaxID=1911 RepID=UPI0036646895
MNYGHAPRFGLRPATDVDRGPGRLIEAAGPAEQWAVDPPVVPAGKAGRVALDRRGDGLAPTGGRGAPRRPPSLRRPQEPSQASTVPPESAPTSTRARPRPFLGGLRTRFESRLRPEHIVEAWPPPALSRLRELTTLYDPDGVFGDGSTLTPTPNHPGGSPA